MMELDKLISFKVIADCASISKASQKLHLSQPALSLKLQQLEAALGLTLFERSNRGLLLTEEGKLLRARIVYLEEWVLETESLLQGVKASVGKIKIGTYTTASSYLLAPVLKQFFKDYPGIEFSYAYLPTDEIIEKVKNLELDCAVISEVPEDSGIDVEPFYRTELILVCSGKNSSIPSQLTKEDLSQYPFLSYPLRLDYCYQSVEKKFGKYLAKAPCPIESESFDTLKQSLLNDLGITFMPRYLIQQELKEKKIRQVQLKSLDLPVTFSLLTKKGKTDSAKLSAFRSFLRNQFKAS